MSIETVSPGSGVPAGTNIGTKQLTVGGQANKEVAPAYLIHGDDGAEVSASDALPVSQTGALPAGDNNIGNVDLASAIPAGTNNIGDVDVASVPAYTTPASGELAGSVTAVQLPNVPCKRAYVKARYDNVGRVYIGVSGVTNPDGTTDTTTGYELSAGDEIVLPVDNLNRLFRITTNAGDDLTYLVLA